MTPKNRIKKVIAELEDLYPEAGIQLQSKTPFQLMVAVILSAQCTDKRVNIITEKLFAKHPDIIDYIDMPIEELEQLIFSAGFYHSKAKSIKNAAIMLIEEFDSEMPDNMEELLKLPGVGRKSANVILGHWFDIPGIVVDTHVIRLSNRLGFVNTKDAKKIEFSLMEIIPKDKWVLFTHLIINHGRAICSSRKPKCHDCVLFELCERNL